MVTTIRGNTNPPTGRNAIVRVQEGAQELGTVERTSKPTEAAPDAVEIEREPVSDRPPADTPAEAPEPVVSMVPGEPTTMPRDLWRDRLRVLGDRAIYITVLVVMYRLRMADKLDPGVTIALLLVAGIRLENVAAFLARKAGASGGVAGALLAMLHVRGVGARPEVVASFFRG